MKKLALRGRSSRHCAEESGLNSKLTARAQTAMSLAHQEALRRGDDYIGTEHLLLGLLGEAEGVAARVLREGGVELEQARAAVDQIVGQCANPATGKRALSVMPRLKQVLEFADQEAQRLRQRYIGTEHLLLGLLREGEGVAAGILLRRGVTFDRAWAQVLAQLASVGQPVEPEADQGGSTAVMCRLDAGTLAAVDALIEAGVRTTRSDAVAWLVQAGIEANTPLLATIQESVAEIRRLREQANTLAQQALRRHGERERGA
jgi:ATP-dependent Clp protease ATP-binding subunit ClpA